MRTITPCDLVHDADQKMNKVVRLHTTLYSDAGDHSIQSQDCNDRADPTLGTILSVDFDQNYGVQAEAQKGIEDFLCAASKYNLNKKLDVTLVGRLEKGTNRLVFIVMCIEQATPLERRV